MNDRKLSGRVALITGGSSGIGRATAIRFACEGAKVVIASRGTARGEAVRREIAALGAEVEFVSADVSDSGQVQALVEETLNRFGRLDYAFNNAAAFDVDGGVTSSFR
jgi:NAD(P)-dependent dehydrogenase (short-subunit alcohol dehydrogenase family)